MKKTFPLHVPGKAAERVIEAIKGELRKYVKRERRKALPEGVDFWDFNCRVGRDRETPEVKPLPAIGGAIDEAAKAGSAAVYIEILAIPGHRIPRVAAPVAALPAVVEGGAGAKSD